MMGCLLGFVVAHLRLGLLRLLAGLLRRLLTGFRILPLALLLLTLLLFALLLFTLLLRRVLVVLLVHDHTLHLRRRPPGWRPLQRKRPVAGAGCSPILGRFLFYIN